MAKKFVYLQGKSKWTRVQVPDKFDKFKTNLYPVEKSLELFKTLGVKNSLKKDDDGYFVILSRPASKVIRGKVVGFSPPFVIDKDGLPMRDVLIGNGSDITVKLDHYSYKDPQGQVGHAIRLEGIRVDNLVPFLKEKDFSDEELDDRKPLEEQPAQVEALF